MTDEVRRGDSARRLMPLARWAAPVPQTPASSELPVSVIVPCYNYGHFLPESVKSALTQDGVAIEVIIVDDCSTDDSAAVAEELAGRDRRITVVRHHHNTGHVIAFNDGLAAASGKFVVRLDADDLLTPGALARAVALFEEFPGVGLVYGHPRHFSGETPPEPHTGMRGWTVWRGADWVQDRCRKGVNCITTPEAMIRSSVLDKIGGLSTTLRFAQDMEMWLRCAAVSDVGRVDGPDQAMHRDHDASMSATSGAGHLLDLAERKTVYEVLFSGPGGALPGSGQLHLMARRALASEALASGCHAYDRGRTGTEDVAGYVSFAMDVYPGARQLRQWRALRRRQLLGTRLAPVPPLFSATVAWRRLHWEYSYRRWQRTGL